VVSVSTFDFVPKSPSSWDDGIEGRELERGTALEMDFYTAGTKMFPRPVPGTVFPERGTQGRSTFPVTMFCASYLLYSKHH
jgi:hypothetical protein